MQTEHRSTLRIAAHIAALRVGGAERRSVHMLSGLAARGHDVVIYCNTEEVRAFAAYAGIKAEISPLAGDLVLSGAFRLAARLKKQGPDVLIIITYRRLWLAALAARIARVPHVVSRIGLSTDTARSFKYRFVLLHWIDDVVLNATSLYRSFAASLPPGKRPRLTVIANGIPPHVSRFGRDRARDALDIPRDAFVVGTVARLAEQKRIDRLLQASVYLNDAHVVIAGDGPQRDFLRGIAAIIGIDDRVHFVGHTENPGDVLEALDVFVVTSEQEGMSSAMLEALAAGVPVVSTPVSGAYEALLMDEECGLIADPVPEAIAASIMVLREQPERLQKMAEVAKRVAMMRYGSRQMIDAWEALLLRGS